jgi:hypothetical protein
VRRSRLFTAGVFGVAAATGVYLILFFFGRGLLNDPDTRWHVAAGEWILGHGAVPRVDIFSHTMPGAPWVSHEWLAEVAYALAFRVFGWSGVVALAAGAAAVTFGLLTGVLTRFMPPPAVLVASTATFFLAAPHITARPHVLAMPCMVGWTAALVIARSEKRAPTFWLLPLMALWANLHAGAVTGVVVAAALAADAVLAAAPAARRMAALRWSVFVAGAAVASLVTPNGIQGWHLAVWFMTAGYALDFVQEWQKPDWSRVQPIELWIAGLVAIVLVNRVKVPAFRVLLIASLIGMTMVHQRNADLVALIGPIVLAEPIGSALGSPVVLRARRRLLALLAPLLLSLGLTPLLRAGAGTGDPKIAPAAALTAARRGGVSGPVGPVFNDFDFGGYLISEGVPVFVDGRVDLYGDAFMEQYADALNGDAAELATLLDRYGVTWTLLTPSAGANAVLDRLPGWRSIYRDAYAEVHVRIVR